MIAFKTAMGFNRSIYDKIVTENWKTGIR